ncbi:MAG: ABC transporter permease [Gemmatimonadaceae bacterium]
MRRLLRLALRSPARARADADEEVAAFVDARVADLVARGATEAEARAEALRRLGGSTITEVQRRLHRPAERQERRMSILESIETLVQDARYGFRQLLRARSVTIIAVLTLALGIGANSAIFAVTRAVLLRPLPVHRPEELVAIGRTTAIDGHMTGTPRGDLLSFPLYQELASEQHVVTGLAASGTAARLDVRLNGGDRTDEHPNGRFVSGNYFNVLGVSAQRGRVFGAEEEGAFGSSPVVVISDAYWRQRFAAEGDVIGRRVRINGATLTIIGVAKPGFDGEIIERPTQIWLPIAVQPLVQPHSASITDRGTSWLLLIGRLRHGVSLQQARAAFTTMIRTALIAHATSGDEVSRLAKARIVVSPGALGFSAARAKYRGALLALQVGVALVLLIICSNLANLLLSRALARRTEMSVRLALGAARSRLVRQLMVENSLIAFLGVIVGLGFARWGSAALARAAGAPDSSVAIGTPVDRAMLLFTAGTSVLVLLLFGLAPALRASRVDLAAAMRAGSRSLFGGGRVSGALLVPVQVMLCLVLVTGMALLTRSVRNIESENPGLDRDHLVLAQVDVNRLGVIGDRFLALTRDVSAELSAIPGVKAVTYSQNGLFISNDADAFVSIPGFSGRTAEDTLLAYDLVGPGYLHAIGARLLRGRDFTDHDVANAPSVTVLNESAARFFFGAGDPIGRVMYFDARVPTSVVGVVADVRDHSLIEEVERRAYAPYAQQIAGESHPFVSFEIRTTGDPQSLVMPIRRAIAAAFPELPQVNVSPVTTLMRGTINDQRLVAAVAVAFGIMALLLCLLGLYGVMAYAVTRRTGEIGLRCALGANRAAILRLVLADGVRLASYGLAAGLPFSFLAATALRGQLHGVPAIDPLSFGVAVSALVVCTLAAAFIPAVRATRVSPVAALAAIE